MAIRELKVRSGADGTLLIFATAPAITRADLAAFVPSAEVSELVVVSGPRDDVVFPPGRRGRGDPMDVLSRSL